jgi:hypothetical protein
MRSGAAMLRYSWRTLGWAVCFVLIHSRNWVSMSTWSSLAAFGNSIISVSKSVSQSARSGRATFPLDLRRLRPRPRLLIERRGDGEARQLGITHQILK